MDTEQPSDIPTILTNDTANYRSSLPLLPKDDYTLKVKEVKYTTSEKGSKLVKIQLTTCEDHYDVTGKELIKAGFPIFDQISLTETENYPELNIQRRLKQFRMAATGEKAGSFFPLQQYSGCTVKATLKVQEAKDGFDERNAIARYITPKE